MYSDQWIKDPSIRKTASIKINATTNVRYWLDENEQLVGVSVNFELADDVHYELKVENWNRFLEEVLNIKPTDDFIVPFRNFLNTQAPQINFGIVLYDKQIEYKSIAFYDFED